MQKNKFIHEDIKAVCSNATKKLVALGLAAATTVGGANFAGLSYKNIASAQTGELPSSEEKKPRCLTPEEVKQAIAKGKGDFSSWTAWCTAHNVAYSADFFDLDAKLLLRSMNARAEENRAHTDGRYGYYEYDSNGSEEWDREKAFQSHLSRPRNYNSQAVCAAFKLRHKLDYLRARIRDYNRRLEVGVLSYITHSKRYYQVESSLQPQSQEPDRHDIEQAPAYVAWATNEVNRLESLARVMLQQLRIDGQEQIDFENRVRWLTPGPGNGDMLAYMEEAHALGYKEPDQLLDGYWVFAQLEFELRERAGQLHTEVNEQKEQIRRNGEDLENLSYQLKGIMEDNLRLYQPSNHTMDPQVESQVEPVPESTEITERADWNQEASQPEPTNSEENHRNGFSTIIQPNNPGATCFPRFPFSFNGGSQ